MEQFLIDVNIKCPNLAEILHIGVPIRICGRNRHQSLHADMGSFLCCFRRGKHLCGRETASEIADHLKDKRTVVLNLESTNKDVARRLIDFLSGVAYAGEGKIKKVAANTYMITPYHVELEGDLIDELENNGLYF